MKLTTVKEIYKEREKYLDKEVTVGGWVRSVRGSKAFGFIVLHDGTFFETLQVVYHDNMPNFAEISKLNVGAAIIVRGTLVPTPEAKQPFEIQADEVVVEGASGAIQLSAFSPFGHLHLYLNTSDDLLLKHATSIKLIHDIGVNRYLPPLILKPVRTYFSVQTLICL